VWRISVIRWKQIVGKMVRLWVYWVPYWERKEKRNDIMRRDSPHHNKNNNYTDSIETPPVRWERNIKELNNEYNYDEIERQDIH